MLWLHRTTTVSRTRISSRRFYHPLRRCGYEQVSPSFCRHGTRQQQQQQQQQRRNQFFYALSRSWPYNNNSPFTTTTTSRRFQSTILPSTAATTPELSLPIELDKVLIANRGEIACRVIRTCRRLKIPTVAIYSSADGPTALHAQMADEAYLIGTGPTPKESYLLQDDILDLAQSLSSSSNSKIAIHPGYGFLSEKASFARKIEEQPSNLVFVGPPSSAIHAMGDKSQSKAIMDAAGVPTTPGYYDASLSQDNTATEQQQQDPLELFQYAKDQIGFPLLIKAVYGGGGKGMRIVHQEQDFLSQLESCQREAVASFGNGLVLLEKYLVNPRHVELQIVADHHGNVIHGYERDCSLQRRHQKIIEEAPASDLPPAIRTQMGQMAVQAAQAVNYVNAGTIEFLVEYNDPTKFYFCEMNTRLQVEHPITECITGLDLMEWQLRIAAGQPLPITNQDDIPCMGHAMEARIYAERPSQQFLPSTGQLWYYHAPVPINQGLIEETKHGTSATTGTGGSIRVDSGLDQDHAVSVYYDPMISKLIVHDPHSRKGALQKLIAALKDYHIAGVDTNIDFLIQCAKHELFQEAGTIHTGFLDEHLESVLQHGKKHETNDNSNTRTTLPQAIGTFASMVHLQQLKSNHPKTQNTTLSPSKYKPWSNHSGSWMLGGRTRQLLTLHQTEEDGSKHRIEMECICHRDGSYDIRQCNTEDDGNTNESEWIHVDGLWSSLDHSMKLVINHTHKVSLTTVLNESSKDGRLEICMWPGSKNTSSLIVDEDGDYVWKVKVDHPQKTLRLSNTATVTANDATGAMTIVAPMPGKISNIATSQGAQVTQGDVVVIMEAMKMEHKLIAPTSGIVTQLTSFQVNDIVPDGEVLVTITPQTESQKEESSSEPSS